MNESTSQCQQCRNPNLKGIHTCGYISGGTYEKFFGSLHGLVPEGAKRACVEASEQLSPNMPASTGGPTATADRGDAIREIAETLERLCIEYACHSRVNGVGNETRAVWRQFKAEIEALKGMA